MEQQKTSAGVYVLRVLFTLFTLGCVLFIFYNGLQEGSASGLRSAEVTQMINAALARAGSQLQLSEHTVRKLAHFTEYMLLGFVLMVTLRVYTRRLIAHISWPMFFGLSIAVADEYMQAFQPARTSSVHDVVIDFGGFLVGLGAALVLMLLIRAIALSVRGTAKGT